MTNERARLVFISATLFLLGEWSGFAAEKGRADSAANLREWTVPDAEWRIAVSPPPESRASVLHIDLPPALATSPWTCSAYTARGPRRTLPLRMLTDPDGGTRGILLLMNRSLMAQAVRAQKRAGQAVPVAVLYLRKARARTRAATARPSGNRPAFPVATLGRSIVRIRTRPYLGREAVRFLASSRRLRYAIDVADFTGKLPYEKWATPPRRYASVLHWSAELYLDRDVVRRFGAVHDQTAWFFFVDRALVAGWKEGKRLASGARLGNPVHLGPGPHRLDFIVVLQSGETIPSALWADEKGEKAGPVPAERLSVLRRPAGLAVQRRNDGAGAGFEMHVTARYVRSDAASAFLLCDLRPFFPFGAEGKPPPMAVTPPGRRRSLALPAANVVLPDPAGTPAERAVLCEAEGAHGLRFKMPVPQVWGPLMLDDARVHIAEMPLVAPEDEIFVRIRVDDCPPALWQGVAGSVSDPGRPPLTKAGLSPASGPSWPVRIDPGASGSVVDLTVRAFNGLPVTASAGVRIVRPDTLPAIIDVRGDRCYDGNGRPLIFVPFREGDPADIRDSISPDAPGYPVVLVDELLASSVGPGAGLDPSAFLQKILKRPVSRVPCPVSTGENDPASAKFAAAPQALAAPDRIVVWAVGAGELMENESADDATAALLFLIQATRRAGCVPVLVAWPLLPGVSRERAARAALLVKELGLRAGVPVVDAWSAALADSPAGDRFARTFRHLPSGVRLHTPNDDGRAWLLRLVADTIRGLPVPSSRSP